MLFLVNYLYFGVYVFMKSFLKKLDHSLIYFTMIVILLCGIVLFKTLKESSVSDDHAITKTFINIHGFK